MGPTKAFRCPPVLSYRCSRHSGMIVTPLPEESKNGEDPKEVESIPNCHYWIWNGIRL